MKKPEFLWILPYFPYPPVNGGNVRIFNLIKNLSADCSIHLVSYRDEVIEPSELAEVEKYCESVETVERVQREGDLPLIFQYYYTPEMLDVLERKLEHKYDFIQIDFLTMAYYAFWLKEKTNIPVLFTEHDVSSFVFEKCFHNRHLDEKSRYAQWVRMRGVVDRLYPLFDAVFTVSVKDANILSEKFPGQNIAPVPTGTDCDYYAYKRPSGSVDSLIYVGHYVHFPNVDSVNYFIEDIFPAIKAEYPSIRFRIVGSGGLRVFTRLKERDDMEVTGTVPDLRTYLYGNGIFVAPIRLGIGIRGKILEAMACGMPVVASRIGAEGVGAVDGENILVADSPGDFTSAIRRLIEDEELKLKLSLSGRKFVEENYDWKKITGSMLDAYKRVTGR